jgi:hypothetical protein
MADQELSPTKNLEDTVISKGILSVTSGQPTVKDIEF